MMTNAARNLPPTATYSLRLLPMQDPEDSRASPTTPAPAPMPSESPTNTENDVPMPRAAMMPPAKPTSDSLLIDCMNQLLEGNESLKLIRHDLLDPEGAFAERQREHRRALVLELKEAVIPRVARLEDTVAEFRKQIESLQADMAKQHREYETKFAEQQACLNVINEMLPGLEKALADARPSEKNPSAKP